MMHGVYNVEVHHYIQFAVSIVSTNELHHHNIQFSQHVTVRFIRNTLCTATDL